MRLAIRIFYITFFLLSLVLSIANNQVVSASSESITVLEIDGTIVPVVADYVKRGIEEAESVGSTACIILLDTPGGLLTATEDIVQDILNANVPVVVYVSPHGAWAASAGTFITISAHIAAMAPGATIGAAHPVAVGESMPEDVSQKATEYSAAWIRSIAEKRGRNPDEAELAVRESKSYSVTQAIENNIIDIEADNIDDLIKKIDGEKVVLADNREIVLDTGNITIVRLDMNNVEKFLHSISDPNIAYILLSLATIGLFTEIANPGLIFPGVAGGVCLLISLYALGALNAYWAGILLILLAFGLFIAELFTSTFGILTAGGITSLVAGSLILFANNPPALQTNTALIVVVAIVVSAAFVLIIWAVVRGQRRRKVTGIDGLVGRTAIVKKHLNPKGMVLVEGELWSATIDKGSAKNGEEVLVKKIDGLRLIVTKK